MKRQAMSEPLDESLSTEAIHKGYGLTWWAPEVNKVDPVILYKNRVQVYRWEYIPNLIEVWDKIRELET